MAVTRCIEATAYTAFLPPRTTERAREIASMSLQSIGRTLDIPYTLATDDEIESLLAP